MYLKSEIQNVSMATAGTEYALVIPQDARKISVRSRLLGNLKMALNSGETASNYMTIPANGSMWVDNIYLKEQTIYFASDVNSDTLEVLIYKD